MTPKQEMPVCDNEYDIPVSDVPGGVDHDSDVDEDDFILFMQAFGSSIGDSGYNPEADYDNNGTITLVDYGIWLQYYHEFNQP